MASWIVHLRIADYFMKHYPELKEYNFAAGNLAPDCGYGKKDSYGEFTPPPSVTHWTHTGSKRDCRYKDFYEQYLKGRKRDKSYLFYLGYYVHLLTDILWSKIICIPTYSIYAEEYEKNPEFLKVIKLDWNDHDFKYLKENPDFEPYNILDEGTEISDFLPYYEHNQLTKQVRFIIDYYKNDIPERDINREYIYLTDSQLEDFIASAPEAIELNLTKRELI